MTALRRATKDIKSLSEALARTTFERHHVAERRLLLQRISGPDSFVFEALLSACSNDFEQLGESLVAKVKAALEDDPTSFDRQWLAAWVSSPVSTRLLHAMQTLMDGCIFQVRGRAVGLYMGEHQCWLYCTHGVREPLPVPCVYEVA